jgi:hypothetical protein
LLKNVNKLCNIEIFSKKENFLFFKIFHKNFIVLNIVQFKIKIKSNTKLGCKNKNCKILIKLVFFNKCIVYKLLQKIIKEGTEKL